MPALRRPVRGQVSDYVRKYVLIESLLRPTVFIYRGNCPAFGFSANYTIVSVYEQNHYDTGCAVIIDASVERYVRVNIQLFYDCAQNNCIIQSMIQCIVYRQISVSYLVLSSNITNTLLLY